MTVPSNPSWLAGINTAQQLIAAVKSTQAEYAKGLLNVTREAKATSAWVKEGQKLAREANQAAETAKTFAENAKGGKWGKLGKLGKFVIAANVAMAAIAYILSIKNSWDIQDLQNAAVNIWETQADEFRRNWDFLRKQATKINDLNKQFSKIEKQQKVNDENVRRYGLETKLAFNNTVKARELAEESRKMANNALYEIREGRKILEAKIQKIDTDVKAKIADLTTKYNNVTNQIKTTVENSVKNAISQLQNGLNNANSQINNLKSQVTSLSNKGQQPQQINPEVVKTIAAQATSAAVATIRPDIQRLETQNQSLIINLKSFRDAENFKNLAQDVQIQALATRDTVLAGAISALGGEINSLRTTKINNNLNISDTTARVKIDQLTTQLQQLQQFQQQLQQQNTAFDANTKTQLDQLKVQVNTQQQQLQKLNNDVFREQQMNQEGINKLNQITLAIGALTTTAIGIKGVVDAIPRNTINQLTPQIPPLVEQGICNSTRGGCMKGALDKNANDINDSINKANNNLLDQLNALLNGLGLGADGAIMTFLKEITTKLGPQLPNGGISEFLKQFRQKLHKFLGADRLLNLISAWGTIHNAYMLSSSLTDTFFGILDNIFNLLIDAEGVNIDTREIIGGTVESWIKSLIGVETFTGIKKQWKAFNRIYQSAANIVNTVRTMLDSSREILEWTGENVGKIGNALRKWGAIAENAFPRMPERFNTRSVWIERLENLQDAADGLEMVSSEVLDIKENLEELQQQRDNFKKGLEELSPIIRPNNKPVEEREAKQKAASPAPDLSASDKEADS